MLDLAMGLLSGAGSLLSGLGARSAAKSQQRRQQAAEYLATIQNEAAIRSQNEARAQAADWLKDPANAGIDVNRMVSDAKTAGFNPLTYLNAGAAAYYDRGRYAVETANLMIPERMQYGTGEVINVPSVAQAVGGAITAGVGTYTDFTKMTRNENLQKYLQNQKLDFLAADRAISRSLRGSGGGSGSSGGKGGGSGSSGGDDDVNTVNVKPWGDIPDPFRLSRDRLTFGPTPEQVGKRYSDMGETAIGLYYGFSDAYKNRPADMGGPRDIISDLRKDGTLKDAWSWTEQMADFGRFTMAWGPHSGGVAKPLEDAIVGGIKGLGQLDPPTQHWRGGALPGQESPAWVLPFWSSRDQGIK